MHNENISNTNTSNKYVTTNNTINWASKHNAVIIAIKEHNIIQVLKTKFGLCDAFIFIQNNVAINLAVPILADTIDIKKALLYFKYTKSAKLLSQSNNPKQNPVIPINIINIVFFYIFFLILNFPSFIPLLLLLFSFNL